MSKHRVDQVNDLMDRVRAHYDQLEETSDNFERAPERAAKAHHNLHGPVHRKVDVEVAFTENLANSGLAQPEAFGRKARHRPVVKSSSSAATRHRMPPQTALGQAGLPPPTAAGQSKLPGWARHEVSYEQAIDLIEQQGRSAASHLMHSMRLGNLTQLAKEKKLALADAVSAAQAAQTPSRAAGPDDVAPDGARAPSAGEDRMAQAPATSGPHAGDSVLIPASMEATSVDFAWPDQSFFMSLANGAEMVSGQGAEFIDAEATRTIVFFGRPPV